VQTYLDGAMRERERERERERVLLEENVFRVYQESSEVCLDAKSRSVSKEHSMKERSRCDKRSSRSCVL